MNERRSPFDMFFVLWIALIGADRINLLGTHASVVITPFIALTPIVAATEVMRHFAQHRRITFSRAALGYATTCAALLAVVFASVMASSAPSTSSARAALLFAQITGTLVIAALAINRDDFGATLARGAVLGVLIFIVFDAIAIPAALGIIPQTVNAGISINLESFTYAGFIPRLSGPVADPNRAGFLLVFFAYALHQSERTTLRRVAFIAALALLALTLSRSAVLALITAALFAYLARPIRLRPRTVIVTSIAAAAALATSLVTDNRTLNTLSVTSLSPLSERFSVAEGSAASHFTLLKKGLDVATESPSRVITGIGYGSSFTVLQAEFPGNKYGNFHSMFVTLFAECGVIALLLSLVLVAWPMIRGSPYRPLIAGAIAFSIFYQATAEPAFWLAVALAWLSTKNSAATHP